jgi:hypothetical protein
MLKHPLVRALDKHVISTHCADIDEYALVLRVDGQFAQFGAEGLDGVRLEKARRKVTIDIKIPKHVWEPLSKAESKAYLVKSVTGAIIACVGRLETGKLRVERDDLLAQVSAAAVDFLASDG